MSFLYTFFQWVFAIITVSFFVAIYVEPFMYYALALALLFMFTLDTVCDGTSLLGIIKG